MKPNVIIVITDDQGYGDLGCTGNPYIQTPNIDRFYEDSCRLTDFHVSPLCAPTRGAILTGRRPLRNGVFATCWGRSILSPNETTMADIFRKNGYTTGLFGKWHLGDNYPYRPQDRGFERVVAHKGGGVGQIPDFWGNNYFDDTYFHNSAPVKHEGYCTDIWFDEAKKFINENKNHPFFAMIATNAPHHPYLVEERYAALYRENEKIPSPEFYGMITNIDENFGDLREFLHRKGLEDNTILIFMTDNGTTGGASFDKITGLAIKGYNGGLRAFKGSYYDGGHRVPFFIRYPNGGLTGGKDIGELSMHTDMLPTFIELCELEEGEHLPFDGKSFLPLLKEEYSEFSEDRAEFIQYNQSTEPPEKWKNAVITRDWRLINGEQLYCAKTDRGQQNDVAREHPEVVKRLRDEHEKWWEEAQPYFSEFSHIALGSEEENPTRLDAMDVMGDVVWNQNMVAAALSSSGRWNVFFEYPGTYRFSLRRWPEELDLAIDDALDVEETKQLAPYMPKLLPSSISPAVARVEFFDCEYEAKVDALDKEAVIEAEIKHAGKTTLEASFINIHGEKTGAYYVYIERV